MPHTPAPPQPGPPSRAGARPDEVSEDIPDAGTATRVLRQLLALLPLEPRGLTDELVRQRRELRQLDEPFFRHYMAGLGERRPAS